MSKALVPTVEGGGGAQGLEERLRKRGTETEESLQKRLARAVTDIKFGEEEGNFDLYLVNDDLERAYRELEDFLKSRYSELK